jgi:hypothetical protein
MVAPQQSEKIEARNLSEVDLRGLKRFASESLPVDSVLRGILVGEDDKITADTFLARLSVWLRLSKLERRRC